MYTLTECPVCKGHSFEPLMTCKDCTVSHETFRLVRCKSCSFLATSPRPDDSELGKYYESKDYISHAPKSSSLLDQIYKISRVFTLRWKISIVKTNTFTPQENENRLLDYGCGTGEFLNTARKKGFSVSGVEPSAIARSYAEQLAHQQVYSSISQTNLVYNAITLWHVLEHVPDLNEKLEQLKERLAKNGTMFIAVPNHRSIDAQTYKSEWAGYDVPRHLWHFNRDTMTQLLKGHSLRIEKIIPMKLDAFYVSMLSEKNKNGKNTTKAMLDGFINGLKSNTASNKGEYSSLIYIIRK